MWFTGTVLYLALAFAPACFACTHFEFLEQLLERSVKQQGNQDAFDVRLDGLESVVSDKLKELDEAEAERDEHVENMVKRLEATEAALGESMTAKLEQHEHAILTLQESCNTPTVLFSAKRADGEDVVKGSVVKFVTVVSNIGMGYNSHTGFFTAPKSGTYLFATTVCAREDQWVYVHLMANGNPIVTTGTKDERVNGGCTSASGITMMRKGDQAWVQGAWNGTEALYHGSEYSMPIFTGVLLHEGH